METAERRRQVVRLFHKHQSEIRALINRHVRHEQDAEDMYQELYLWLVCNPPLALTNVLAYLSKVIRSRATDAARRTISYSASVSRYAAFRRDDVAEKEPEDVLIQSEQLQRMTKLIESALPPHAAQAILERYIGERTMTETAAKLGVNERTVSHYCCTGLKKIRQLIDEGKIEMHAFL